MILQSLIWQLKRLRGKMTEKEHLVEQNIALGQKIDEIRLKRKAIRVRLLQIDGLPIPEGLE